MTPPVESMPENLVLDGSQSQEAVRCLAVLQQAEAKRNAFMKKSAIEWTESTWNPVTGCTKLSPGCKHCYAERMALRLQAMGHVNYEAGFNLAIHEHMLDVPMKWKKPQTILVNSMSDLLHDEVPFEFISRVFEVMRRASWHTFQVLTKRSRRWPVLDELIDWPQNAWMGVTLENQDYTFRIDELRDIGAPVKFLSLEPLLGPLPRLNLQGIDWVIVGGESGPKARPMKEEWAVDIKNQCVEAGTRFFFKQRGRVQQEACRTTSRRAYLG